MVEAIGSEAVAQRCFWKVSSKRFLCSMRLNGFDCEQSRFDRLVSRLERLRSKTLIFIEYRCPGEAKDIASKNVSSDEKDVPVERKR